MYQCDELISNTRKFIHADFQSVAEMNEFLNLKAKGVERWISSDEISVAVEADVFKIVFYFVTGLCHKEITWDMRAHLGA